MISQAVTFADTYIYKSVHTSGGTGKTHLASGLCVAACHQKKRARFITAAGLVNELVEAQHHNQLGRVLQKWGRYDLIVIDEHR